MHFTCTCASGCIISMSGFGCLSQCCPHSWCDIGSTTTSSRSCTACANHLTAAATSALASTTEGDEQVLEHGLLMNKRYILRHTLEHHCVGDEVRRLAAPSHEEGWCVLLWMRAREGKEKEETSVRRVQSSCRYLGSAR